MTNKQDDFSEATDLVIDEVFAYMASLLDATLQDARDALRKEGFSKEDSVKKTARLIQACQSVADFMYEGTSNVVGNDPHLNELASAECEAVDTIFQKHCLDISARTAEYIGHDGTGNDTDSNLN